MLWVEFPRNPNSTKFKAYRAWLRLTLAERENCFDGALAYVAGLKAKGKIDLEYVPHLSTFINERRFETFLEAAE